MREPRTTIGGVNLVAGFRPELWAFVAPDAAPAGVVGFNEPIEGVAAHDLPATQHDIVIWLAGASYDVVFDTSRSIVAELMGRATLANEIVGWQYHHDRDLTGFEDGSENPSIVEATSVALVPPGLAGEGSSILLLQQWAHDAISWEALPVDVAGGDHRSQKVGQRGARPKAADLARRAHRPGSLRQDLPPERRLRDRVGPRDDLRRVLREPGPAPADARKHGRSGIRAARPTHERRPSGHRRVLRHPVSRPAGGIRRGRPSLTVRGRGPDDRVQSVCWTDATADHGRA